MLFCCILILEGPFLTIDNGKGGKQASLCLVYLERSIQLYEFHRCGQWLICKVTQTVWCMVFFLTLPQALEQLIPSVRTLSPNLQNGCWIINSKAAIRKHFGPRLFSTLKKYWKPPKSFVIPVGLYLLMFTLIKMKTRKSLKHKNSKAHILFVIRAMKSSCHGASEKFHKYTQRKP